MESFADVLHNLIDHVFSGDLATKAHDIIDRASGTRSPQPDPPAESAPPAADATVTADTSSSPADATEAPADPGAV